MRRAVILLALLLLAGPAFAQSRPRREPAPQAATAGAPPHAWLFGLWTGGLFPVLDGMATQDCKAEPTIAFTRDTVGHTSLLGNGTVQRIIETVRTTSEGAEFRFSPDGDANSSFGCDDPNVLHVKRENANTIDFPNCSAFPYPLVRCPTA